MRIGVGYGNELVVFTDLDGTLLSETYELGPAREALDFCQEANIPVVFVSSKTRKEIERLQQKLGNNGPFIPENGGAVFLPQENWDKPAGWRDAGPYWCLSLGTACHVLCLALKNAAHAVGAEVLGFSEMPVNQVAEVTGLSLQEAALAQVREYDEPFIIQNETDETVLRLQKEIQARGLKYTKGGLFHHITGDSDKGEAVYSLMSLYREANPAVRFAGIGDAKNDLPMLRKVDQPFLVRKPNGSFEKVAYFTGITITEGIGPQGFSEAINLLLKLGI